MDIKEKKFIFMVPDTYTLRVTNTTGLCLILGLQELKIDDIQAYEPIFKLSTIRYDNNNLILDKYVFIRSKSLFAFNDFFKRVLYPNMLKSMINQSELLQPENRFMDYTHRLSNKYEVSFSVINSTKYKTYTIFDIEMKFINLQNPKLSFFININHEELITFFKYLIQVENNLVVLQQPSVNLNNNIIKNESNEYQPKNIEEEIIRRSFEIKQKKENEVKKALESKLKKH